MKKNLLKNTSKYLFIFTISFLISFNIFITKAQEASTAEDTTPPVVEIKRGLSGIMDNLNPVAKETGYSTNGESIEIIIGRAIQLILSFVGVIFLIFILISGLQWMMAGGNEEVVEKAKRRIKNATFGLAIIFAAYAITFFITDLLISKTGFGV